MPEDYCSYCGNLTGFINRKCRECERTICTKCWVKLKEIDEEEEGDDILWDDSRIYCGNCAVTILEKRNRLLWKEIYCPDCGNKMKRGLGNFCPKCGAKINKVIKKEIKSVRNK